MSDDTTWDEESRENLRDTIRNYVLGEVRLAKCVPDDIVERCNETYIMDECPEEEWETFVQFTEDELEKAVSRLSEEQTTWPTETDCDRLDHVEATLRERGILLWQVSPCCDSCTVGELSERIDIVNQRHPGLKDRVRGYAFFIDQNMADMLAEKSHIGVYLGYGSYALEESSVTPDVREKDALGIANEVCDGLRKHGFEPKWDGSYSKKIGIYLHWQRRTRLE